MHKATQSISFVAMILLVTAHSAEAQNVWYGQAPTQYQPQGFQSQSGWGQPQGGGNFNYQQWGQTMRNLGQIEGMAQQRLQNTMNEMYRLQAQQQNRKKLTTQDILNQMNRQKPIDLNAGTQSRPLPSPQPSNRNSGMSKAEWDRWMQKRREQERINGRGGPVANDIQQGIGRGVSQVKKGGGYIHNTVKRWGVIR